MQPVCSPRQLFQHDDIDLTGGDGAGGGLVINGAVGAIDLDAEPVGGGIGIQFKGFPFDKRVTTYHDRLIHRMRSQAKSGEIAQIGAFYLFKAKCQGL